MVIVTSKSPKRMWPITAMRIDTASTVYPTSKIHGKAYKESTVLPCSYSSMTESCVTIIQSVSQGFAVIGASPLNVNCSLSSEKETDKENVVDKQSHHQETVTVCEKYPNVETCGVCTASSLELRAIAYDQMRLA